MPNDNDDLPTYVYSPAQCSFCEIYRKLGRCSSSHNQSDCLYANRLYRRHLLEEVAKTIKARRNPSNSAD